MKLQNGSTTAVPETPFSDRTRLSAGASDDLLDSMSLKTRVVLLVVVMLAAGIWALAISVTWALQRDLMEMQSANLSAEVISVAEDLDRDVRLHVGVLTRLAASLTPEIFGDSKKLNHALDEFTDSSVIVPDSYFAVDSKGIVIAGYPVDKITLGASVKDVGYFGEVMASGKPVIGVPEPGRTSEQGSTVPIAVPLHDRSGVTTGVLVGKVKLADPLMFGQIAHTRIGKRGYFLVVAPKDRLILAAPDPGRILRKMPPKGALPQLDRRLDEGFKGAHITLTAAGIEQLGVARKMATTGWVVLAGVPTKDVFAPIEDLKRRVYLAAVLISLAVAVILRFVLGRQIAPLSEAARAMRSMTEGKIPLAPIPISRADEIGELVSNFNQLVAERSRLEEGLRESKDRLDGIYRSVGEGIVSVDEDQRIVLFNAAAEQLFGVSAAAVIGQPLGVLLPERFRTGHEQHVRVFGDTGMSRRQMRTYGPILGRRANGEEFPIEAAVSQSGTSPNKLFTVILRDITERVRLKEMREQLVRQMELFSERLAAAQEEKEHRIAYELHEKLGQELAALNFYLQMLGPGGAEAESHREEALVVATQATERIRKLVLNLEPPELEDFGLYAAAQTYCERQGVAGRFKLHIDAPRPEVRAPQAVERACFRVLREGMSNILRHSKATEVWVRLRQDAGGLEFWMRDNGVGFDRNAVGDVTVGLFGMRIWAKQVGGWVEIKSTTGAGTEIRAVFPFSTQPA